MCAANNSTRKWVSISGEPSLSACSWFCLVFVLGTLADVANCAEPFEQYPFGYELIVGRPGSDIEMVLSTVYHIGNPPRNLPYRYYLQLKSHRFVKDAVPIAMGDTTEKGGFPLVGTTRDYFDLAYAPGKKFLIIASGETLIATIVSFVKIPKRQFVLV